MDAREAENLLLNLLKKNASGLLIRPHIIFTFDELDKINPGEKEQVEEAQKEVEDAQVKVKAAQDAAARASQKDAREKAALEKQLEEANQRAAAAEAQARKLERNLRAAKAEATPPSEDASRWEEKYGRKAKADEPEFITTHELTSEETLRHLALKYYNHATPPYWQLIFEANSPGLKCC